PRSNSKLSASLTSISACATRQHYNPTRQQGTSLVLRVTLRQRLLRRNGPIEPANLWTFQRHPARPLRSTERVICLEQFEPVRKEFDKFFKTAKVRQVDLAGGLMRILSSGARRPDRLGELGYSRASGD